jgi:DHA1 family bicyclomycin/chloramphenicol resistance-like MFS transporter
VNEQPGQSLSSRRRLLYILLLGVLTSLGPLTVDLYLPAFPEVETDLQTTQALVQLTLVGTTLGLALGQLIAGPLSDRFGRRAPLVIASGAYVAASTLAAVSPGITFLVAIRFAEGMAASGGAVIALAVARDLFHGRALALMISRLALVSGVSPIVAPVLGSQLLRWFDWRGLFIFLAAYGLVITIGVIGVLRESNPKTRRLGAEVVTAMTRYRTVLGDRTFVGSALIGGSTFAVLYAYLGSATFIFQDGFGLSAQAFGLLFAANSVGIVLGIQVAARLAPRLGPQWVLVISTSMLALFATVLLLLPLIGAGTWTVLVPLWLVIFCCGLAIPCVQLLCLDQHGAQAGTAASLLGSTNWGFGGIVVPLMGLLGTGSIQTMAITMLASCAIGICALWFVVRPRALSWSWHLPGSR